MQYRHIMDVMIIELDGEVKAWLHEAWLLSTPIQKCHQILSRYFLSSYNSHLLYSSTYGGPSVDCWPIRQDWYDSDRTIYLHVVPHGHLLVTSIDYVLSVSYIRYSTVICFSNGAFQGLLCWFTCMLLVYLYYSHYHIYVGFVLMWPFPSPCLKQQVSSCIFCVLCAVQTYQRRVEALSRQVHGPLWRMHYTPTNTSWGHH